VFVDETSKDGCHAYRKYARSSRGTKAVVKLPFSRGNRVSVLAALNLNGFIAWKSTRGTFTRQKFHEAFTRHVIPRSLAIAQLHCHHGQCKNPSPQRIGSSYPQQTGARLLFLPPYAPQLNPIEICFGRLKRPERGLPCFWEIPIIGFRGWYADVH